MTHKLDGAKFFCDFTSGLQYDELSYGQYDVAHGGYTLISIADFQNPTLQQAFIFLYNKQQGANLIAQWTSTNCCFKTDNVVNTANMLLLAGQIVYPATSGDVTMCNGLYTSNPGHFAMNSGAVPSTNTLDSAFFTTFVPTAATNCTAGANPAFFWRRH